MTFSIASTGRVRYWDLSLIIRGQGTNHLEYESVVWILLVKWMPLPSFHLCRWPTIDGARRVSILCIYHVTIYLTAVPVLVRQLRFAITLTSLHPAHVQRYH
jgi:hypothetical protein